MTALARCRHNRNGEMLLRPMLTIRVLLLLAVVGALAAAQVHLRFRTRDLQIETRKLQKHRADLLNQRAALVSSVEALKRYDEDFRLYAVGRLGLQESSPSRTHRADIDPEVLERWERLAQIAERPEPTPESKLRMMAELGERMLSWSTPLMARDPEK
jgi:hypothetical protein